MTEWRRLSLPVWPSPTIASLSCASSTDVATRVSSGTAIVSRPTIPKRRPPSPRRSASSLARAPQARWRFGFEPGTRPERIDEFDATAHEVLVIPAMVGG